MSILKWLDLKPHPGNMTKITAVVAQPISQSAKSWDKAIFSPEEWELTIAKRKKKRSNDANAYYWSLVDKIADAMGSTKAEIHSQLLGDYGAVKTDENGEMVTLLLKVGTDPQGFAEYTTFLATYPVGQETYNVFAVCKGSSEMNTKEFSRLLDGTISECKELGIEVLSDAELKRMLEALK